MVLDPGHGKFKQLANKFGFRTSKFGNRQTSSVMNLGKFTQMLNSNSLGNFKQLSRKFFLGLKNFKPLPNGFDLESWEVQTFSRHVQSWEVQTAAQQFRACVLKSSNNCPTVLNSGLEKFEQMPKDFDLEP